MEARHRRVLTDRYAKFLEARRSRNAPAVLEHGTGALRALNDLKKSTAPRFWQAPSDEYRHYAVLEDEIVGVVKSLTAVATLSTIPEHVAVDPVVDDLSHITTQLTVVGRLVNVVQTLVDAAAPHVTRLHENILDTGVHMERGTDATAAYAVTHVDAGTRTRVLCVVALVVTLWIGVIVTL